MREHEVKILNINRKEVEEKLISLGAKKIFDGSIEAAFFDFKDGSIRKSGKTVRLRRAGDKTYLTYKSPIAHDTIKIREEYEIEVSNFETAKKIVESVGLREWLRMKKHRTSYAIENVRFEIDKQEDQYNFVPEFLEIEATDVDTIYKYVKLLGFKKEDCKPWTILDIVKNLYPEKSTNHCTREIQKE